MPWIDHNALRLLKIQDAVAIVEKLNSCNVQSRVTYKVKYKDILTDRRISLILQVDKESPFASQPTWWQSDTWWDAIQSGIAKIGEALHVNITLAFGKSYHISGKIRVTFYSERPQAMIIERSDDGGVTYNVYQYFAEDCVTTYGMSPSESPSAKNPLEVIIISYRIVQR